MQCIYLFTPQEAEIVGNSRQSSSVVNSLGSFFMAPHKSSSCLWLFPFPPYDNFKKPLPLCFSRSHKYNNYDKATYIVSSNLCLFNCRQATGFPQNPYPQKHISGKRVFLKFIPLFLVLTFQIIYQDSQVRVSTKKTEHQTTFEISSLSKQLAEKLP